MLLRRKTEIHRARKDCDGMICIDDEDGSVLFRLTVEEALDRWEPLNDKARESLGLKKPRVDDVEYSFTGI